MSTSTRIEFGLFDITAKSQAEYLSAYEQPYSRLEDVQYGTTSRFPIITFEPNYWLLDGNYWQAWNIPTPGAGWTSSIISDEDGNVRDLTPEGYPGEHPGISFEWPVGQEKDIKGVTIQFSEMSGDWCDDIRIICWRGAPPTHTILSDEHYYPTGPIVSIDLPLDEVTFVWIQCHHTNKPFRYPRIASIEIGTILEFNTEMVKECMVVQYGKQLSLDLPIGSAEIKLNTLDADFSIVDPSGDFFDLQFGQPLDIYETVNGTEIFIGRYYLNKWENTSEVETYLQCVDALGMLEVKPYPGRILSCSLAYVLPDITSITGIVIEWDSAILNSMGGNWWAKTCREALQWAAYITRAYVVCAGSKTLQFKPSRLASSLTTYDNTVTKNDIGLGKSLTLKPYVNGVELVSYDYLLKPTAEEIFNGNLVPGWHKVNFSGDYATFTVTTGNATILQQHNKYVEINVNGVIGGPAVNVIITGKAYYTNKKTDEIYDPNYNTASIQNVISIDLPIHQGPNTPYQIATAQFTYDYLQQRYVQTFKLYGAQIIPGQSILVDTFRNKQIKGIIERVEINLAGGFISTIDVVGVVAP